MRNVSSLISGVGVFFLGSVASFYQFVLGIMNPQEVVGLNWALFVMGGSLLTEGGEMICL